MLGSYMEDLGISSEQFESACDGASSKIKGSQFHQMIFEPVGTKLGSVRGTSEFKQNINIISLTIGVISIKVCLLLVTWCI